MTITPDEWFAAEQERLPPTKVKQKAAIERMVITAADGRTWDLGSPSSKLFRLRVAIYRLRRRSELRHG